MKTLDRTFGAFSRAAAREMPTLAHELVRGGDNEAVPHLWPMHDPAAVLAEDLLHFANRDVHRVARHERALPRLGDHLVVSKGSPAMLQQDAQDLQRLRPEAYLGVVA